jgi:hypothetical protein
MKIAVSAAVPVVMRGLDPRIHDERARGKAFLPSLRKRLMDRRIEPGNDSGEAA